MGETFCRDPFFDVNTVWNTTDPNLTQCMQDTLLIGLPCCVLLITSVIWNLYQYVIEFRHVTSLEERSFGALFFAKLVLNLILIVNAVGQLWNLANLNGGWDQLVPSEIVHYACLLGILFVANVQVIIDKWLLSHTSPPLFLFWLVLIFCEVAKLKIDIQTIVEGHRTWEHWVLLLSYFPVILVQLVLSCISDIDKTTALFVSPEDRASFLSLLTFSWFDGLIWKGARQILTQDILPKSPRSINVGHNVQDFLNLWRQKVEFLGVNFASFQERPFIGIWSIFIRTQWVRVTFAFLVAIIHLVLPFVNPQILKLLINHVDSDEEAWKGYFYTVVLLISATVSTITFHVYQQHLSISAIQMRSAIIGAIYRKSLKLSNHARRQFTVGEITNYMSVDAQRVVDTFPYTMALIMAPLTIIVAMYFLFLEVGISSLAGLAILLILIPINGIGGKWAERLQVNQLKAKDKRLKLMNEVLMGMRVLKLYAWENPFMDRIKKIRDSEVKILRLCARLWAFMNFTFTGAPILVTIAVFALYVLIDPSHVLTADKIFVSLSLFNLIRIPLVMFPFTLVETIKLIVSLKRINTYLNANEINSANVSHNMDCESDAVELKDLTLTWDEPESPTLMNISIQIPKRSLVAVVGEVGSGKSSLLSAILGEMEVVSGSAHAVGSIAYVPQQAWIQNMSLKDNILFDKAFVRTKYDEVVRCCQLESDLAILKNADSTEIGENGINLSGGQKQRVSLARAVYSDADLYLLDDPLSAVDAHVGKSIFTQVFDNQQGLLKDKTRILVTHNISVLSKVDNIIVMKGGRVVEIGSYQKLLADGAAFSEFLNIYAQEATEKHEPVDDVNQFENSHVEQISEQKINQIQDSTLAESGDLIKDERAMVGRVKWSVYWHYVNSSRISRFFLVVCLHAIGSALLASSNYWLSIWADANQNDPDEANTQIAYFLGIYGAFGVVQLILEFSRELMYFLGCATASQIMHEKLLYHVFRSPMSFFDTNPTGRIINRFSSDVDVVDQRIPQGLSDTMWSIFDSLSIVVVICVSTPSFGYVILPLVLLYYFIQRMFISTSRQVKRLESLSKSPIYANFSETITGTASIRAYGEQIRFNQESENRVQKCAQCTFLIASANRWLGTRVEILGNLIVFFAAIFAILARDTLSPGVAGLSITYALNIMDNLNWLIRMLCELETNSVALERIIEYTHNDQEADWESPNDSKELSQTWPNRGKVEFDSLAIRYRKGLDLVLKGISMEIQGQEKIGICGRTGAGKSSFTLALFRILEADSGEIRIDGQDISKIGLHALRSRITIIPQDPVLFTGDLRFNLDPTGLHSDSSLWSALEHAHLKSHISSLKDGLDHEINEGGENFSVGQRQLICLARALLRKTKILIMDEATAAVDLATDDLIQATIRREFKDCTVITIAHRLNTIMDCDRIAVFNQGEVAEYAPPRDLLSIDNSALSLMAKDAGLQAK